MYNYIMYWKKIDLKYSYLYMIFWDLINICFHNLILKQKHVKINKKLYKSKIIFTVN